LLEQAITGVQSIVMTNANYTLTNFNGTSDEARNAVLVVTGTNGAIRKIIAPLVKKTYIVYNNTTGGFNITIGGATGNAVTILNGVTTIVYCDGVNFFSGLSGSTGNFSVNGSLGIGTSTPVQALEVRGNIVGRESATVGVDSNFRLFGGARSGNPLTIVSSDGLTSSNNVIIGGGTIGGEAATNISFNTAASVGSVGVGTTHMTINSSGNVGIGTTSPNAKLDVTQGNAFISTYLANANSYTLGFTKSRAAVVDTNTIVQNGDNLGAVAFYGADGSTNVIAAQILGQVDGTPGVNDMPGRLVFSTTADGASSITERMRISSSGLVTIAANGGLSISATAVTAPDANDGNVFSGTYTPDLTNVTNVAASTRGACQYMRVGNTVTVSGQISIDPTTAGADTVVRMTLPIASNFSTTSRACGGVAASLTAGTYGQSLGILGFASATGQAEFRGDPTVATSQDYSFSFTYRII
jgi:enamine deaminase RidA (YjgF/YER057c/UK114 family)